MEYLFYAVLSCLAGYLVTNAVLAKRVCKHKWAYSRGRSPAQCFGDERKYKPRHSCLRRVCVKCKKEQEISNFSSLYKHKGDTFFAGPVWIDGHSGKKDWIFYKEPSND